MNEDTKPIKSRNDLVEFLKELSKDTCADKENWENWTLEDYFESIGAFLDADGLNAPSLDSSQREKVDESSLNWSVIADIFLAGKYYA